jgi:hypothetical protein
MVVEHLKNGGSNMTSSAKIKLVPSSAKTEISTEEVKELLKYYKMLTAKTAEQVNWHYDQIAFPYEITDISTTNGNWLELTSCKDRYHKIIIKVHKENVLDDNGSEQEQTYIKISLPTSSTYGDKGKANEFCKFLAKKLKGELHLFNNRVMYFYQRK